jgi:hypothetical protein
MPLHQVCDFLSSVARAEGLRRPRLSNRRSSGNGRPGFFRAVARAGIHASRVDTDLERIDFQIQFRAANLDGTPRRSSPILPKLVGLPPQDPTREIVHFGFANALAAIGVARGTDWRPSRIELATDPIDVGAYVPEFADIPVSFNQPQTSIWFDQKWLSEPLPALTHQAVPWPTRTSVHRSLRQAQRRIRSNNWSK